MPKQSFLGGLINGGGGQAGATTGGFIPPSPVLQNPSSIMGRGPGAILPERGSRAQLEMVQALMGPAMQGAQNSNSPLLAFLAPMVGGAVGARTQSLYKDAQQGRDSCAIDQLLDAMGGGGGGVSTPSTSQDTSELAKYTALSAGGGPTNKAAEWLRYANQDAVRNDPLSSDLTNAMSFLPELGVTMEVFSGGQENNTTQGLGSTRHNHGNAADVFFYKDGRKLDWNNPADVPIFQEIVRRGKANGLTGFGAGPGYMQAGSMHLGYGDPAVWGAGGKGSNAPDWLRQAYSGGAGGTGSPVQMAQSSANTRDLLTLMMNPDVSPELREMAGSLAQNQLSGSGQLSPLDQVQLQRENVGLQTDQAELAKLLQPPKPEERYRPATPEEAAQYGSAGGQIGPDGRFYPTARTSTQSGEAGVLRQRNEATTIISKAVENQPGLSPDEALAVVARNPIYAEQFRILGIDPALIARESAINAPQQQGEARRGLFERFLGRPESGATTAPPPPSGFTEDF